MVGSRPLKVMFLCTANSCRSQMAEGFARALGGAALDVHSAGLMAAGVNRRARAVMQEAGVDISGQESKEIDPQLLMTMDVVITLCSHAEDNCPAMPPHVRRLHWSIRDPVGTVGTEEEVLADFRRARDEIRRHVADFVRRVANGES